MVKNILATYKLDNLFDNTQLLFNLDGKGNLEAKNIVDHKSYWKRYIKGKIHQEEEKVW